MARVAQFQSAPVRDGLADLIIQVPLADTHAHDVGSTPATSVLAEFQPGQTHGPSLSEQVSRLEEMLTTVLAKGTVVVEQLKDPFDALHHEDGMMRNSGRWVIASKEDDLGLLNQLLATKKELLNLERSGQTLGRATLEARAKSIIQTVHDNVLLAKPDNTRFAPGEEPLAGFFDRYKRLIRDLQWTRDGTTVRGTIHQRTDVAFQEMRTEPIPDTALPHEVPALLHRFATGFLARARLDQDVKVTATFNKKDFASIRGQEQAEGFRYIRSSAAFVDAFFIPGADGAVLRQVFDGLDAAGQESAGRTPTLLWLAACKRLLRNAEHLLPLLEEARAFERTHGVRSPNRFEDLLRAELNGGDVSKAVATLRRAPEGTGTHAALEARVDEQEAALLGKAKSTNLLPDEVRLLGQTPQELSAILRASVRALRTHAAIHQRPPPPVAYLGMTIHAGEQVGKVSPFVLLDQVEQCLQMGVDRIGHGFILGVEAKTLVDSGLLPSSQKQEFELRQAELLRQLKADGVVVELNMTSNLTLLNIPLDQHVTARLLASGVRCTLNTDDESILRTDIRLEVAKAVDSAKLNRHELAVTVLEGFDSRLGQGPLRNRKALATRLHEALTEGLDDAEAMAQAAGLAKTFRVPVDPRSADATLSRVIGRVVGAQP